MGPYVGVMNDGERFDDGVEAAEAKQAAADDAAYEAHASKHGDAPAEHHPDDVNSNARRSARLLVERTLSVSAQEEAREQFAFVRGQRDALLLACRAVTLFYRSEALVSLDVLEKWDALTAGHEFSTAGLHAFVTEQMKTAGVSP